jgi:hypothetical protein
MTCNYILKPLARIDFVKSLLKLKKSRGRESAQHTDSTVFVKPEQEKALVAVPSRGGAKEQPLILLSRMVIIGISTRGIFATYKQIIILLTFI